jgi:hypothetical protein
MRVILLWLVLTACAANSPNVSAQAPVTTYRTAKTLAVLEECLTESLSEYGVVTAVSVEGTKTLMFRAGNAPPMVIDLEPPSVKVTTRFAEGTRGLVKACL